LRVKRVHERLQALQRIAAVVVVSGRDDNAQVWIVGRQRRS
jgi:hypothetical protein